VSPRGESFTLPPAALSPPQKMQNYKSKLGPTWADVVDSPSEDYNACDEFGNLESPSGLNLEALSIKEVDKLDKQFPCKQP
jgi:hypothetical protein